MFLFSIISTFIGITSEDKNKEISKNNLQIAKNYINIASENINNIDEYID